MRLLVLLFLFAARFASAGDIFGDEDFPLSFLGSTEAEVRAEIQRVADWSKAHGWSDGKLPAIVFDSERKLYTADLKPLLPHAAQGMCIGQNCHGSSLFSAGILPASRSVGEDELPFWLESPLCRPIGPTEKLEPGD